LRTADDAMGAACQQEAFVWQNNSKSTLLTCHYFPWLMITTPKSGQLMSSGMIMVDLANSLAVQFIRKIRYAG
jgi:hypothetical protein